MSLPPGQVGKVRCFDVSGELIYRGADAWNGILDDGPDGPCTEEFPVYSTSRIVAGGPITGEVFTCHVQGIDEAIARGVYGDVTFSDEELARLAQIFPAGVCDYSKGDARKPGTL